MLQKFKFLTILSISLLAVALGAGAAGTLNMWYESDLDALMSRTCLRPIPTGKVKKNQALYFGIFVNIINNYALFFSNLISSILLLLTISFYFFIYTIWLKRKNTTKYCYWWSCWSFTTCNWMDYFNRDKFQLNQLFYF